MTDADFFEDSQDVVEDEDLDKIGSLGRQLEELDQEIAVAEEALKALKKKHLKIATETLPELMDSVQLLDFTTADGVQIKVTDNVQGSLPKDMTKREAALNWLKKNGAEGLIKDSITVEFDKGKAALAHDIMVEFTTWGVDPELKEDVNHMSLKAFAREQFGAGVDVPFEALGLWRGRITKVKRKK
jgi:hypothetical protein